MTNIHYEETEYGFEFGAAKVTRLTSDTEKGWVVIKIETPKYKNNGLQIYVTKTGKIRIFSNGEWEKVE